MWFRRENTRAIKLKNEMLEAMVRDYRQAFLETAIELAKVSDRNTELVISTVHQPRCEEWGLLHTLCTVLEANGTEFEPGSVLSRWWSENKGAELT